MPSFEFKLPDIGEGVTEGEIVEWLVAVGDDVAEDDPMVEVMTDKATVTIGAPRNGTISDIRFQPGAVAQVGQVIVVIAEEGASQSEAEQSAKQPEPKQEASATHEGSSEGPAATAVGDIRDGLPGSSFFTDAAKRAAKKSNGSSGSNGHGTSNGLQTVSGGAAQTGSYYEEKPLATPATRKLARDLGVDLRHVRPSGDKARVTKADVQAFAETRSGKSAPSQDSGAAAPRRAPEAIVAPTAEAHALR